MDAITTWALSIHNSLIREIGLFLDQDFFYTMVIIGLVLLGERKNDTRLKNTPYPRVCIPFRIDDKISGR